jgi:hypothetical protein
MLFNKAVDFIVGREHRFVRDYLMMSGGLLIAASALGIYLSNNIAAYDPMPTASISSRTEVDSRIYSVVRSVLDNGEAVRITADRSVRPADGRAGEELTTGSLGDDLRRVTIDPCTGEEKK